MEFLDKELNKICLHLGFSIDKINYIKTELFANMEKLILKLI